MLLTDLFGLSRILSEHYFVKVLQFAVRTISLKVFGILVFWYYDISFFWNTFSLNSVLTAILFATKEGNVVFSCWYSRHFVIQYMMYYKFEKDLGLL